MLEFGECFEFRDPIHGLIKVNEMEREIINTAAFQRLKHIRQLATTYMVYHGAEHSRFGHSLGVMHIAGKALDTLKEKEPLKTKFKNEDEYNKIKYTLRLAALLHDVGHSPFSHAGEKSLFPIIKDVNGSDGQGHEVFTRQIIKEKFSNIIDGFYEKTGVKTADVLSLLMGNTRDNNFRFAYDLISGQLDCDKMDYLLRDSHYCGVRYGKYDLDKILNSLCICEILDGEWQLGIMSDGVYAVEEFIYARYWMFLQVYFHKTRRIYDRYLENFLLNYLKSYPKDIDSYLSLDDNDILNHIKALSDGKINIWAKRLFNRDHIKEAFLSPVPQLDDDTADRIGFVIERFKDEYDNDNNDIDFYIDQADSSAAKDLIKVPYYLPEAEEEVKLPAVPVKDKHTNEIKRIQDYSIPLSGISEKKINILRIYASSDKMDEVKKFCVKCYYHDYEKEKERQEEDEERLKEYQQKVNENNMKKQERINKYKR